ncbi:MAG TPA: helix-turn-helix transcriptional regulator [Polyangia bacterium]|jgi:excisionase family DNA binding protein|nr:helix-turn-helix transcriptional regulator [Polyangia bacterium]
MEPPSEEPLLTTAEVAALLQIHPKQVYRLLRRGLPGRRLGGEWRFLRREVLAWMGQAGREEVAAEAEPEADRGEAAAPGGAGGGAPPFLAANGDVAVELLLALVNEGAPILGFVQSDRERALRLLERGRVLAAGCHGQGPPARLGSVRLARIHLVEREVGLVAVGEVPPLARLGKLRFATRPPSAGIVVHLDEAIRRERLDARKVLAGARPLESHREVVCAVLRGEADVGLATRSWAARLGLGFRALATEGYGLLVRAADLGDARVVRLCEVAQSEEYRRAVAAVPGYDAAGSGDIRYDRDESLRPAG